jgi:hypothetical protein
MNDVLYERFAVLADRTDDSDWLDVRGRARRGRRHHALAAVAALAAVVAVGAVAAGGRWVFSSQDHRVTAVTQVSLAGRTWRVSLTTGPGRWLPRSCIRLSSPGHQTITGGCGPRVSRLVGPPFGARRFAVPGGQIWVGTTVGFARRIAITGANGRVYAAQTVAAPRGTKTPFRYWALAVDGTARTITAYGARGQRISKAL